MHSLFGDFENKHYNKLKISQISDNLFESYLNKYNNIYLLYSDLYI